MKLDSKVYDILKWVAQIVLPAAGTLYFALSTIWGLPYGEQVVGTLTAIDAFLGALLGVSIAKYEGDGVLRVDTSNAEKDIYRFDLNMPLDEVKTKKQLSIKVDPTAKIETK